MLVAFAVGLDLWSGGRGPSEEGPPRGIALDLETRDQEMVEAQLNWHLDRVI